MARRDGAEPIVEATRRGGVRHRTDSLLISPEFFSQGVDIQGQELLII